MKFQARRTSIAAMLVAGFVSFGTGAAAETSLRLLSGWTPNNPNVPHVEAVFIKNVAEATKGEVKIQRSGPEVVPPFDQLQPVAAGVFDFLFTTPGYHQAQSGVASVFDAVNGDVAKRRETGLVKWADDYYQKRFGLRIIAVHAAPGTHLVLRAPLPADSTLKGLKVRTTPVFEGLVRQLGGTPVTMSPTDAYAAMQKGVLDGIAFPAFASADYKLYEVGKFMTRPVFGLTNVLLMMNVKKFDSLPPNVQKTLIEEGEKLERAGKEALAKLGERDEEIMTKNGVKPTNFNAATAGKLNELYNDGIFKTASRTATEEVKAFWEFAKSKNMLNQ